MPVVVPEGDDLTTARRRVRLLLNDVAAVDSGDQVFTDDDVEDFLALEGWSVKRAAAQAIDTNATNEALASKVLRTQDLQTDGAKLADAMRKHAAALREQADAEDGDTDGGFFETVDFGCTGAPELTNRPYF